VASRSGDDGGRHAVAWRMVHGRRRAGGKKTGARGRMGVAWLVRARATAVLKLLPSAFAFLLSLPLSHIVPAIPSALPLRGGVAWRRWRGRGGGRDGVAAP